MTADRQSSQPDPKRLEQATDWLLRLREPDVAPADVAEWMQWHDACEANRDAFARVQALWQAARHAPLRPVTDRTLLASDTYAGDERVEEWLTRVQQQPPVTAHGFRRTVPWAAAALVLIAVLFVTPWRTGATIETEKGANREVTLADGSHVVLGAASALTPKYSEGQRTLHLERGEAYFKVKPDKNRPFVVVTSSLAVTAVGTAFNVRTDDRVLRVTVAEGTVDVGAPPLTRVEHGRAARATGPGLTPVRLRAGQQLTVGEGAQSTTPVVSSVDPELAAAWVTGTLQFRNEPLSSVVAAVNRYSTAPIELQQDNLRDLRYTGTVVTDRIDEWLAALPNAFPLEVTQEDESRMIVRARD